MTVSSADELRSSDGEPPGKVLPLQRFPHRPAEPQRLPLSKLQLFDPEAAEHIEAMQVVDQLPFG